MSSPDKIDSLACIKITMQKVREALERAANADTSQTCSPGNESIAVAAMDALKLLNPPSMPEGLREAVQCRIAYAEAEKSFSCAQAKRLCDSILTALAPFLSAKERTEDLLGCGDPLHTRAVAAVQAITRAAIACGEMGDVDEAYLLDLDATKADIVLTLCGRGENHALVKAIERAQKKAHTKPLLLRAKLNKDITP